MDEFVEVGYTAMRDPVTGDFLPAVPLFIRRDDMEKDSQERLINDLGKLFAQRFKDYKEGCKAAGATV